MMTLNEIVNISFRKANFSGYRTEDVDAFIDQVKDSYDELIKKNVEQKEQNEALAKENEQLAKKIEALAAKIEEYRDEEDEIKNALVSAQKLSDASIREARHKAEIIIKDANLKAERIVGDARGDVEKEKKELERLKQSIADFRTKLLGIYKEHLTMIDAIPVEKAAAKQEDEPKEQTQASEPAEENVEAEKAEPVQEGATQEFVVDVSGFEAQPESVEEEHDLRYDVLGFEDDGAEGK